MRGWRLAILMPLLAASAAHVPAVSAAPVPVLVVKGATSGVVTFDLARDTRRPARDTVRFSTSGHYAGIYLKRRGSEESFGRLFAPSVGEDGSWDFGHLPPIHLPKGRWDAHFFTDGPSRIEIPMGGLARSVALTVTRHDSTYTSFQAPAVPTVVHESFPVPLFNRFWAIAAIGNDPTRSAAFDPTSPTLEGCLTTVPEHEPCQSTGIYRSRIRYYWSPDFFPGLTSVTARFRAVAAPKPVGWLVVVIPL